ncbi:hypothetical protein A7982_12304 [Minicystis rosea]|nr:hypothetical protein A7982_12304 [Minicystis rosea]
MCRTSSDDIILRMRFYSVGEPTGHTQPASDLVIRARECSKVRLARDVLEQTRTRPGQARCGREARGSEVRPALPSRARTTGDRKGP